MSILAKRQTAPQRFLSTSVVEIGRNAVGTLPPSDLTAEAVVLGTLLALSGVEATLVESIAFLRPEHFYSESHRWIFEAILEVSAAGVSVDFTTVAAQLRSIGRLQQIGDSMGSMDAGEAYLLRLITHQEIKAENIVDHAHVIHGRWRLRRWAMLADQMIATVYETSPTEDQAALNKAVEELSELAFDNPRTTSFSNLDVLKEIARRWAAVAKGENDTEPEFTTSLPTLDRMFGGGLKRGKKYTFAATPGGGKTAFGKQIALRNAERGVPVLYFCTEQPPMELVALCLAQITKLDSKRVVNSLSMKDAGLTTEQMRMLQVAVPNTICQWPIRWEHHPALTIDDIVVKVRAEQRRLATKGQKLGIVVVDHLHELKAPKGMVLGDSAKREIVEHATSKLKELAQKADVAVIELAQQKQAKTVETPTMYHVAWSAKVSETSDALTFIWQPTPDRYQALAVKVRGGEVGAIDLDFNKPHSTITEESDGADVDWHR